ncbi:MAG: DUF134 domain-containing protein [Salinivirgaceae bacterium]
MARKNRRIRKVLNPPIIKGFKPYGLEAGKQKEAVNLLYEEYEALRLSDYDGLNHFNASVLMDVSRPTFTRIYASALQKIALAFVEGRQISIEGGKVYFDSDWYHCKNCKCYFNNPEKEIAVTHCALCGSNQVSKTDFELSDEKLEPKESGDYCICPGCGHQKIHEQGIPCSSQVCPSCGNTMRKRKGQNI